MNKMSRILVKYSIQKHYTYTHIQIFSLCSKVSCCTAATECLTRAQMTASAHKS